MWYITDLREKQNQPLNARGFEITRLLIDAVQSGILLRFTDDRLNERLSLEEFNNRPTISTSAPTEKELLFGQDNPCGAKTRKLPRPLPLPTTCRAKIYTCRNSKKTSFLTKPVRACIAISNLTMILPAKRTTIGVDKPIATFSFKEIVENVFRDNPSAIGFNNQNLREHRNMAEAFELRLFRGHLYKYANGDDKTIAVDISSQNEESALHASLRAEHGLVDSETYFWENLTCPTVY